MTTITASRMISTNGKTIKVSLERGTWDEEIRLDGMLCGTKTHPIDRTEIVIYDASGKAVASGSGLSGLSKAYNQYNEAIKRGCIGMVGKCYLMPDTYNLIASALVGIVLSSRALSQEYAAAGLKAGLRGAWTERRILWNFSFPAVISGSMVTPITWAANAILVNQPNGYAELGLFNAANQFRMIVILIPNVLAIVTVPLLSEIYSQKDREYFARATNLNLRTMF